jgi:hypothetical protein
MLNTATTATRLYRSRVPVMARMDPRPRVLTAMIRATVPSMENLSFMRFNGIPFYFIRVLEYKPSVRWAFKPRLRGFFKLLDFPFFLPDFIVQASLTKTLLLGQYPCSIISSSMSSTMAVGIDTVTTFPFLV